jgi:hypothetical protein
MHALRPVAAIALDVLSCHRPVQRAVKCRAAVSRPPPLPHSWSSVFWKFRRSCWPLEALGLGCKEVTCGPVKGKAQTWQDFHGIRFLSLWSLDFVHTSFNGSRPSDRTFIGYTKTHYHEYQYDNKIMKNMIWNSGSWYIFSKLSMNLGKTCSVVRSRMRIYEIASSCAFCIVAQSGPTIISWIFTDVTSWGCNHRDCQFSDLFPYSFLRFLPAMMS